MKSIFKILFLIVLIHFETGVQAKTKPVLKFNENGKFKILQFTDIHYKYNSYRSDSALQMIIKAMKTEQPDLVVLTGDVVCSAETKKAWMTFVKPFTEAKIPWCVVLGNHDIESDLSGREIMKTINGLPYGLTENGPETISGSGNYVLKVEAADSDKTKAVLYFLDSHSGLGKDSELGSYDWIKPDQVQWYLAESKQLTKNNRGDKYPALAFFHIPLPEYKEVWGMDKTVGIKQEDVCSPDINSGMYSAFLEAGDVMGMFTGHDHDNNYIGSLHGICLAYGQSSGRETYGSIGKGYRVIELHEGQRKFDSWVRILYNCDRDKNIWTPTGNMEKVNPVSFPDSFKVEKVK
ncbi:MAG TPA: metallophosphoesterase family protein [Draconibacterium sp.]|nr:metallophosphoesterase family protein [Draconibacterium sp.]HRX10534.1 metallophosphoesterase family protein [Draconibacterium sp.]